MAPHPELTSVRTEVLAPDWSASHSSAERSSLECSRPSGTEQIVTLFTTNRQNISHGTGIKVHKPSWRKEQSSGTDRSLQSTEWLCWEHLLWDTHWEQEWDPQTSPSPRAPQSTPAVMTDKTKYNDVTLSGEKCLYLKKKQGQTLSSFSHFSSSCFRPCWRTGLQSSRDSNLLSWPWSSKMPKYWSRGDVWPGWAGTLWKRRMVSGVRRIPWEEDG